MHFNTCKLESIQIWGQIKKIKDPLKFFQTRNNKIWYPVLGITNNEDFEYFEDLEDYFSILDARLNDVAFVRILHEEDSISIHGGIFRNPFIAFKAWHNIISFLFNNFNISIIKSRVNSENNSALNFLFNSGFTIKYSQKIDDKIIYHFELQLDDFNNSILNFLYIGKHFKNIKSKPLLIESINNSITQIPDDIKNKFMYFAENSIVIYDSNLLIFCLIQTYENYHEICIHFRNEDFFKNYPHNKEIYIFSYLKELTAKLNKLIKYNFLFQVSKSNYNISILFRNYKYIGRNDNFLFFE
jgi:hypothetical protein